MGTVELIVELESRFDIRVPVSEFGRDDWNTANKIGLHPSCLIHLP